MSKRRRLVNVHGTQGYHKDWQKDTHTFPVLAVDQLTKEMKDIIEAVVKTITTGDEAEQFIHTPQPMAQGLKGHEMGWSYVKLDRVGDCGVLRFHGTCVALFYKRQVNQVYPQPGDPVPENTIAEPADAWQRFSLIGASARQANRYIKQHVEETQELKGLLQQRVDILEERVYLFEKENKGLKAELEAAREKVAIRKGRNPDKFRQQGHHDAIIEMLKPYAEFRMMEIQAPLNAPSKKSLQAALASMRQAAGRLKFRFIFPEMGEELNPKTHEVVGYDGREGHQQPGTVAQVTEAGYVVTTAGIRAAKSSGMKLNRRAKVILAGKNPSKHKE